MPTHLIIHPVQESGYHREHSRFQCVEVIWEPTNISLEIANPGSLHEHHSLSERYRRETLTGHHNCSVCNEREADTQGVQDYWSAFNKGWLWELRKHTIPALLSQTYEPRAGRKYGHHWDTMDRKPKTGAHTDRDAQIYKHTPMTTTQTNRQEGNTVSVNVYTSTTLSNMWARGRKDSITSSEVVWA